MSGAVLLGLLGLPCVERDCILGFVGPLSIDIQGPNLNRWLNIDTQGPNLNRWLNIDTQGPNLLGG